MASRRFSSVESLIDPAEEGVEPIELELLESDPSDPSIDTGKLFHEIAAELAFSDVKDELREAITQSSDSLSGVEGPQAHEEILAREKAFFTKVFGSALAMAEAQPGKVTVLFDMDQTAIQGDMVRPALPLLIRELDNTLGDRFEIGILSSRRPRVEGEEEVKDKLAEPLSGTRGVGKKLNRDFVISSGRIQRGNPALEDFVLHGDPESQIRAIKDVIDPAVVAGIRAGARSTSDFYDIKLMILQHLVTEHPERGFIMVDDLPFADAIDPHSPNANGVWVREEILEKSWNPYSDILTA